MSSYRNQWSKLVAPPLAAPEDDHALVEADRRFHTLVEADRRFQAALAQAIVAGGERVEAMRATVQLKRRTKPSRWRAARPE
jgi:hypothetical protein